MVESSGMTIILGEAMRLARFAIPHQTHSNIDTFPFVSKSISFPAKWKFAPSSGKTNKPRKELTLPRGGLIPATDEECNWIGAVTN